jgi:YggT family protein
MLLAQIINMLARAYILIVFVSVILSYFMDMYHPVRRGVDNLVQPLLNPIRKVVPPVGAVDLSPLVLIILVQVVSNLLVRFLTAIS